MSVDMERVAEYVLPERCAHCGHKKITWSPEKIITAALAWKTEHGKAPLSQEWRLVTYDRPSTSTVQAVFGSWNRMIEAAGLDDRPREHGSGPVWSKDEIANVMLDYLMREGRWPVTRDWVYEGGPVEGRPSLMTVIKAFGSWNAAKLYAGWDPDATSFALAAKACAGCGCDLDVYVTGCRNCADRRSHRARRDAPKNAASVSVVELLPIGDSDASQPGRVLAPGRAVDLTTEKAAQAA